MYGFKKFKLEPDSQIVTSCLAKSAIYFSDLDSALDDVLSVSSRLGTVIWSRVKEVAILLHTILLEFCRLE